MREDNVFMNGELSHFFNAHITQEIICKEMIYI